jgi:hypothetical protein
MTMHQLSRAILDTTMLGRLGPTLALGAVACLLLVALSLLLTGEFVFESAPAPGEPEHVSPYFGGVVGALLTTGLFASWQALAALRADARATRV